MRVSAEALARARREGGRAALLHLHLGPVQGFIREARRTHDLWMGSFLCTYLTFQAMRAVADAEGVDAIVSPYLRDVPLARAMLFGEAPAREDAREEWLRSSLPDKLVALVPEARAEQIARRADTAVRTAWEEIATAVRAALDKRVPGGWALRWDEQIRAHLEIDIVAQPWPEQPDALRALLVEAGLLAEGAELSEDPFGSLYDLTLRVMRAHRDTTLPATVEGDARPKCSQCGAREQMGPLEPGAQREFFRHLRSGGKGEALQLDPGEGLCAVCLTKRFAPRYFFGARKAPFGLDWDNDDDRALLRFPSVPSIASAPFRWRLKDARDKGEISLDTWRTGLDKLPLNFDAPGNLLPALGKLGRGDELLDLEGWWLYDSAYEPRTAWRNHTPDRGEEMPPELKQELPALRRELAGIYRALGQRPSTYYAVLSLDGDRMGDLLRAPGEANPLQKLSKLALALYEVVEERYLGRIVYSGGDELLALLPLQTALPCLGAVRAAFRSEAHLGGQVTVSAGVGIAHVRTPLRQALRLARDAQDAAKGPRNSFAIKLDRRSGESLDLLLPFEAIESIAAMLEGDESEKEHPLRNVKVAYQLREEARTLAGLPEDAFACRARALLGERFPLPPPRSVHRLVDLLLFVRFLLREERGIETAELLGELKKKKTRPRP